MLLPLFVTEFYFLHRLQPNTKCIIFVNRIVTARSLSHILRNLKFLSAWKCGFLVGVHAGLVTRKNTNIILEKFRSGEVTLFPSWWIPPSPPPFMYFRMSEKFERTVCLSFFRWTCFLLVLVMWFVFSVCDLVTALVL